MELFRNETYRNEQSHHGDAGQHARSQAGDQQGGITSHLQKMKKQKKKKSAAKSKKIRKKKFQCGDDNKKREKKRVQQNVKKTEKKVSARWREKKD